MPAKPERRGRVNMDVNNARKKKLYKNFTFYKITNSFMTFIVAQGHFGEKYVHIL